MLGKLFAKRGTEAGGPQEIVVVSGLPRSGTSMMMKMLAEGGLQIVTDALRSADDDNPNGYFEFEPVKGLAEGRSQWLAEARGKVVKIISALLEYLPAAYHYKVIFMEREINEVLSSQRKMLSNRREDSEIGDAQMEQQFREHLKAVKYWLARQPNLEVLYVDYNRMLASPGDYCRSVADFLGLPLDLERMGAVPNERLYRNRAGKS
jgi:hypothetical protein